MTRFAQLCLVLSALAILALNATPAHAEGGISPIPCSSAEVIPMDPKFDALPDAKAYFGAYEGGFYRFEVPNNWNGELALYMHGTNFGNTLSFSGPQNGLRTYWIQQGFAWGASTYRCKWLHPWNRSHRHHPPARPLHEDYR